MSMGIIIPGVSSTVILMILGVYSTYLSLLSNKYYICDKKDSRYVPYGYELYHEIGETTIYINKNTLPVRNNI